MNVLKTTFYNYYPYLVDPLKFKESSLLELVTLVSRIWEKTSIVRNIILTGIVIHQIVGPNIKIMNMFDLKGFLIVMVLLGNSYFCFLPPHWLNMYAAACMIAREWNFWSIYSKLTSHTYRLNQHNIQLSTQITQVSQNVSALEIEFSKILSLSQETKKISRIAHNQFNSINLNVKEQTQSLEKKLEDLIMAARSILNIDAIQDLFKLTQKAQKELYEAQIQHKQLQENYKRLMKDLDGLNQEMRAALEILKQQQSTKTEHIELLKGMIDKLKKFS